MAWYSESFTSLFLGQTLQYSLRHFNIGRMPSSGVLRRVDHVRTDISDEHIASTMRLTRIGELETTLDVSSNRGTLRTRTIVFGIVYSISMQRASVADYL
jgi:hypothetical protein